MVDSYIVCKDCLKEFVWRKVDKEFLQKCIDEQTPHPTTGNIITELKAPVRCVDCRKKRKEFFSGKK